MFFRNLTPKRNVSIEVTLVQVHMPVRLGHRDAEKAFAVPLARQLAAAGLGVVTSCSAFENAPADILGVDLHLGMTDASRDKMQVVARMLEHLKAPHGSSIRLAEGGEPIVFGVSEGLELTIGADAAPDADARRTVAQTLSSALKEEGVFRGWVQRGSETVFYFYGEDFARMRERLDEVLAANPRFRSALTRRMA